MSKIIDREGANFGQNVFQNSKVLKEMNQLDREDTVGLMTGTRSSEYLWRKSRTAFYKKLRFSPISKGKGCLAIATLPTFNSYQKKVKVGFRVVMAKYLNNPIL